MVHDDVAGLSGGGGADHALGRDDLADEGVLRLGNVRCDAALVPVGLGLEEIEVTITREGGTRDASHRSAVIRHLGDGNHVELLRKAHAAAIAEGCGAKESLSASDLRLM